MGNICSIYKSSIGLLTIVNDGFYITHILYGNHSCDFTFDQKNVINNKVMTELDEYFNGSRKTFDMPLKFNGTDFQKKVWNAICKIPYGETRSYSEIADDIRKPTAVRAIGMANSKNPIAIIVPCHRVINANGSLAGYSGGTYIKKKLLELEKSTLTNINQKLIRDNRTSSELLNIALLSTEIHEFYYYPQDSLYIIPNRTAEKYHFKTKYENAPYSFCEELIHPNDKENFYNMHNAIQNGEHSCNGIYRSVNSNYWWKIILSTAEYDEDKKPLTTVGIVEDVTKEKQLELEKNNLLNMNKEILSSLNNIFIGVHRLDLKTGKIRSIRMTRKLSEFDLNIDYDFTNWVDTLSKYYHPNDRERLYYQFSLKNIIKNRNLGVHNLEENYRRFLGDSYHYISNNIILNDKNFTNDIAIIVQRDISDNYQKNNIIHALSSEYYAIYHLNIDEDTYEMLRSDMEVKNKLHIQPIGCYSYIMNNYIKHFVHEEDIENMTKFTDIMNLRNTLIKNQNDISTIFRKKIGNHYEWIQLKYIITPSEDNHFITLAMKNIDESIRQELDTKQLLKDALSRVESANQAKNNFLSKMSHDILNPMTSIMGLTTLAKVNIKNSDYVKSYLENISKSSQQLLSMMNQLLDMSRIETDDFRLQNTQFKFSEFIQSTIEVLFTTIKEKNIQFNYRFKGICYDNIVGDKVRLQQLLHNLLINAIKYTNFGGKVDLIIEQFPTLPNLTVPYKFIIQDNGIGISQDDIETIFEPFTRANDIRIQNISGSGLGLTIASNIVKLMNGKIKVDSNINKGSTFTVTLNLSIKEDLNTHKNMLPNVKVLVVNSNETELRYICNSLNYLGINTKAMYLGKDVLNELLLAHEKTIDYFAVIIDDKISDIYFLDLIKDIRKNLGRQPLKILVSSYNFSSIENIKESMGIDEILRKPIFYIQLSDIFYKMTLIISSYYYGNPFDIKPLNNTKCLLVESNEIHKNINQEILQMLGSQVSIATNSYEAIENIKIHNDYDYILMDTNILSINGYETSIIIRKINEYIPIIAITSNYFIDDVSLAIKSKMNAHLVKPIDNNINILLNTILSNIELSKQLKLKDNMLLV